MDIVLFPQVVHMMAEKPDWTTELGPAFATDRAGVFKSIPRRPDRREADCAATDERGVC